MQKKKNNLLFILLILMIPTLVIFGLIGYQLGVFNEPKLNMVTKEFPKQVFKRKDYPITATNSKIRVNGKEIIGDNYRFNIPLENGQNKITLTAFNILNRQSTPTEININNLQNDWLKTQCNNLDFVLNTDQLQYGYSGIINDELPEFRAKLQDIARNDYSYTKLSKFNCEDTVQVVQNHARIYPKNTRANCWNCDGNSTYIAITSSPALSNNPGLEINQDKNELQNISIYKSLSGIEFKLVETKSQDLAQYKYNASFEKNGRNYTVSGFDYVKEKHDEFKANFYSVLDNIYPVDYNNNQQLQLNNEKKILIYNDNKLKGFRIDYPSSWQLLNYNQPSYTEQKNLAKTYDYLELKKDDYTIRFTIYPSTDTITSGAMEDENSSSNYTKYTIDSKEIEIPKVISLNTAQLGNSTSNIRALDKVVTTNDGKKENSYNYIIETKQKKIVINLEYNGLNYEYVDGVTKRIPSNLDDKKDKEILEIFKSIKWGE
jgi:hypothetical protein